jgi:uncharacterized protein YjgD (DUF1641 family)
MATPLGYRPPDAVDDQARLELDDLVAALHDSGLLRTGAGAARSYPDLLRPLLRSIDARAVRSALELVQALGDLDPDASRRLSTGVRRARTAAAEAAAQPPEGPVRWWRRLRDPDTRRGISAALAGLAALGAALRAEDDGA